MKHAHHTEWVIGPERRKGANGAGVSLGVGGGNGDGNGDINGDGDGERAGTRRITGVEEDEGTQNGNGDGSGDGNESSRGNGNGIAEGGGEVREVDVIRHFHSVRVIISADRGWRLRAPGSSVRKARCLYTFIAPRGAGA